MHAASPINIKDIADFQFRLALHKKSVLACGAGKSIKPGAVSPRLGSNGIRAHEMAAALALQICWHFTVFALSPAFAGCFASKVRNRTWVGSVQGAVATWSVISMRLS